MGLVAGVISFYSVWFLLTVCGRVIPGLFTKGVLNLVGG